MRERAALVELAPGERVAFAWDALGPDATEYEVRSWLLARGVQIDRAALAAGRPVRITATVAELDAAPGAAATADVAEARTEQAVIRNALRERHPEWPAATMSTTTPPAPATWPTPPTSTPALSAGTANRSYRPAASALDCACPGPIERRTRASKGRPTQPFAGSS